MKAVRIVGWVCAMGMGLMLGFLFGGGALTPAVLFIGAGVALTLGICAWAEWQ